MAKAPFGLISVLEPVLKHCDLHKKWEPPATFAVTTFRAIMYSIKDPYFVIQVSPAWCFLLNGCLAVIQHFCWLVTVAPPETNNVADATVDCHYLRGSPQEHSSGSTQWQCCGVKLLTNGKWRQEKVLLDGWLEWPLDVVLSSRHHTSKWKTINISLFWFIVFISVYFYLSQKIISDSVNGM